MSTCKILPAREIGSITVTYPATSAEDGGLLAADSPEVTVIYTVGLVTLDEYQPDVTADEFLRAMKEQKSLHLPSGRLFYAVMTKWPSLGRGQAIAGLFSETFCAVSPTGSVWMPDKVYKDINFSTLPIYLHYLVVTNAEKA